MEPDAGLHHDRTAIADDIEGRAVLPEAGLGNIEHRACTRRIEHCAGAYHDEGMRRVGFALLFPVHRAADQDRTALADNTIGLTACIFRRHRTCGNIEHGMIADPDQTGRVLCCAVPHHGDGATRGGQPAINGEICPLQANRLARIDADRCAGADVDRARPGSRSGFAGGGAQDQAGTAALDQTAVGGVCRPSRRGPYIQGARGIRAGGGGENRIRKAVDRHNNVKLGAFGNNQAMMTVDVVTGETRLEQRRRDRQRRRDSHR